MFVGDRGGLETVVVGETSSVLDGREALCGSGGTVGGLGMWETE